MHMPEVEKAEYHVNEAWWWMLSNWCNHIIIIIHIYWIIVKYYQRWHFIYFYLMLSATGTQIPCTCGQKTKRRKWQTSSLFRSVDKVKCYFWLYQSTCTCSQLINIIDINITTQWLILSGVDKMTLHTCTVHVCMCPR